MSFFGCVCVYLCVEGNVDVERVNVLVHSVVEEGSLSFLLLYIHTPLSITSLSLHTLPISSIYMLTHVHTYTHTYFMMLHIYTHRFEMMLVVDRR